jgi:hypothetical protein
MEVSGQLHASAALPLKRKCLVLIAQEAGWLQSRSGRGGEEKNPLTLPGIDTWSPSLKPVAILTELSRLALTLVTLLNHKTNFPLDSRVLLTLVLPMRPIGPFPVHLTFTLKMATAMYTETF